MYTAVLTLTLTHTHTHTHTVKWFPSRLLFILGIIEGFRRDVIELQELKLVKLDGVSELIARILPKHIN